MLRWAVRLFRREWRQQLLVLTLLAVAVAATIIGIAVGTNATTAQQSELGTANHQFTIDGSAPRIEDDLDAARAAFGTIEVISHQSVPIPGSVDRIDVRDQAPDGPFGQPMLRLVSGRYPAAPDEAAVTDGAASGLAAEVGSDLRTNDRVRRVVGVVENPLNLSDEFVLVPIGEAAPAAHVSFLTDATEQQATSFHTVDGAPLSVQSRDDVSASQAAATILAISTVGMLFIGLLAVSGFTVMAQRRLRALGMLESIGATDRHVRLVMIGNGAVVGLVGGVAGAVVGLLAWLGFAPHLERMLRRRVEHVNRFDLPWWSLAATIGLAVLTAVAAAWWPARSVSRVPVVAALSGRPPEPRPTHRSATVGALLAGGGYAMLALADRRPPLLIAGILTTTIGVLFLAPMAIRGLAALGRRAPVAVRLALRDLARYQARSGAALGAITLAVGIAATITVAAASAQASSLASAPNGNLPDDQMMLYVGRADSPLIPEISPTALSAAEATARQIASTIDSASLVTLQAAVNPDAPAVPPLPSDPGGRDGAGLVQVTQEGNVTLIHTVQKAYVATPELLAEVGLQPGDVDPTVDVISPLDPAGFELGFAKRDTVVPKVQRLDVEQYTSAPTTLITASAVQRNGLQPLTAGWLLRAPEALTPEQIDTARQIAAEAGLTIETREAPRSLESLGTGSTAVGVGVALAVLAMTVGLIRSETAADLRTLTAAGASTRIRRSLVATTAGALGLLGALLGTVGAHLAVLAWNQGRLGALSHTPLLSLLVLLVGLPVIGMAAGWLLAGRRPPDIAHSALT